MEDIRATRIDPGANQEEPPAAESSRNSRQAVLVVLGGTGMLRPAVEQLLREGEAVVVVARHASRTVAELPEGSVAVDADWSRPGEYVQLCAEAVAGRDVLGVIVWVHQPYRDAITRRIEALLFEGTRIVRLWGSASGDPRAKARASYQPRTGDLCEVYLGSVAAGEDRSWLTHEQISRGALAALRGNCREHTIGDLIAAP